MTRPPSVPVRENVSLRRQWAVLLSLMAVSILAPGAVKAAPQEPVNAASTNSAADTPSKRDALLPGELLLVLDPAETRVAFTVGATFHHGGIHGSSDLTGGEVRFNPETGTASGEIVVDVASTTTHSDKRDKHMHEAVLETAKYPLIVFVATSLEGEYSPDAASDIDLAGHLDIHGEEHPMTLHAHVVPQGNHLHGTAAFEVPYVEWGMKNPSKFLLKVAKTVHVDLDFGGNLVSGSTTARYRFR